MFNLAANRDNVCKLRLTDDHIARKLSEIIPWELSSGMDGQIHINALPQPGDQPTVFQHNRSVMIALVR